MLGYELAIAAKDKRVTPLKIITTWGTHKRDKFEGVKEAKSGKWC